MKKKCLISFLSIILFTFVFLGFPVNAQSNCDLCAGPQNSINVELSTACPYMTAGSLRYNFYAPPINSSGEESKLCYWGFGGYPKWGWLVFDIESNTWRFNIEDANGMHYLYGGFGQDVTKDLVCLGGDAGICGDFGVKGCCGSVQPECVGSHCCSGEAKVEIDPNPKTFDLGTGQIRAGQKQYLGLVGDWGTVTTDISAKVTVDPAKPDISAVPETTIKITINGNVGFMNNIKMARKELAGIETVNMLPKEPPEYIWEDGQKTERSWGNVEEVWIEHEIRYTPGNTGKRTVTSKFQFKYKKPRWLGPKPLKKNPQTGEWEEVDTSQWQDGSMEKIPDKPMSNKEILESFKAAVKYTVNPPEPNFFEKSLKVGGNGFGPENTANFKVKIEAKDGTFIERDSVGFVDELQEKCKPENTKKTGNDAKLPITGHSFYVFVDPNNFDVTGRGFMLSPSSIRYAVPAFVHFDTSGMPPEAANYDIFRFNDDDFNDTINLTVVSQVISTIGPEGGKITLGEFTLEIPPDALSEATEITVSELNITTIPSCFDSIQNGDETGVDCGGSCLVQKLNQSDELCGLDSNRNCVVRPCDACTQDNDCNELCTFANPNIKANPNCNSTGFCECQSSCGDGMCSPEEFLNNLCPSDCNFPKTCTNFEKDDNEIRTDCGGPCKSKCEYICNIPNLISFFSFDGSFKENCGKEGGIANSDVRLNPTDGVNGSAVFDGNGDYVDYGNGHNLDFFAGGEYTWTAWVKRARTGVRQTVIDKKSGSGGYSIVIDANNKLCLYDPLQMMDVACSNTAIEKGWTHIAVTYNNGSVETYINGTEEAIGNQQFEDSTNSNLIIGGIGQNFFEGMIDEIMIFNVSMASWGVADLFKLAEPVTTTIECVNLDREGETYSLTLDIVNNGLTGPCFTITAPGITLDCRGHWIRSDDDVAGVYSNQPGTTVKNCRIDMGENYEMWQPNGRYGKGIDLYGANNSIILDNTLNGQGYGLYIYSASNVRAEGNTFSSNAEGIYMKSSSGNVLTNNKVNSSKSFGVLLVSSMNNTLSKMTAVNTNGQGITLDASSGNVLSDVVTNRNGYGIWLQSGSNSNRLINVTSDSNGQGGIRLLQSSGNRITNGEFNLNDYEGIAISRSSNNVIERSRACFNTRDELKSWRSQFTYGYFDISCFESSLNSGRGNTFGAATKCSDGWPSPGADYSNCSDSLTYSIRRGLVAGINIFDFNANTVAVDKIDIISSRPSPQDVVLTVSRLEGRLGSIMISPPGDAVYAYLDVTAQNLDMGGVQGITVHFSVPKSWIAGNNIDNATIKMYTYENDTWKELETSVAGEDAGNVLYSALAHHFSSNAITGSSVTGAASAAPGFEVTVFAMAAAALFLAGLQFRSRKNINY